MKLSIVIPAFNEEKRIARTLQETVHFLSAKGFDFEIILVDDGSTDRTVEIVKRELDGRGIDYRLIGNKRNRGKGYSVRVGMLAAEGDFVLFTDADLSTPIEEMEKLTQALQEGYDVAIGSRGLRESRVEIHQGIMRELMGKVFNRLARALTFKDIQDSQCGFKAFRREVACRLFSLARVDGFSFDAEILYLAQRFGFKIKEVPVVWRNSQASKVHILWDPLRMIRDLFLIRLYHMGFCKKA